MLQEPNCYKRNCKYYIGVIQPDGTELTEINVCKAYPDGIPNEIAYGNDLHLHKRKDQDNDLVYTKEK